MSPHFISGEFKSGIGSSFPLAADDRVLNVFLKTNKPWKCLSYALRRPTARVPNLSIVKVPHTHYCKQFAGCMLKNSDKQYIQPPILLCNFYSVYITYKCRHRPHNINWQTVSWRLMLYSLEEKYQHCRRTSCFHVQSRRFLLCWKQSHQNPPKCWHPSTAEQPFSVPYLYPQTFCWKSLNPTSSSTTEMPNKFIMTYLLCRLL